MAEPMEGRPITGDDITDGAVTVADVNPAVLTDCRAAGESTYLFLNFV
jgi:hypothetical protein